MARRNWIGAAACVVVVVSAGPAAACGLDDLAGVWSAVTFGKGPKARCEIIIDELGTVSPSDCQFLGPEDHSFQVWGKVEVDTGGRVRGDFSDGYDPFLLEATLSGCGSDGEDLAVVGTVVPKTGWIRPLTHFTASPAPREEAPASMGIAPPHTWD
jgi:hypothetical protein